MTTTQLGIFIVLVSTLVVGVTFTAFAVFNRFMQSEKQRGERMDAVYGEPSPMRVSADDEAE